MHKTLKRIKVNKKKKLSSIGLPIFIIIFACIGTYFILSSHAAPGSVCGSGDLNQDGIVNVFDLSILLSHWGQTSATQCQGDINQDGTVNIFDLSIMLSNWGESTSVGDTEATQVGAPTPTGLTCTTTLNAGADVNAALSAASPGSVVCLNSGSWSTLTLTSIAPASPGVTLAATPGETVEVPGIELNGANSQNLTIEGFNITQPDSYGDGIDLFGGISGGVTVEYNTIEDMPNGYGVYSDVDAHGDDGYTQTGVTIEYNQIDHITGGVEVDGSATADSNFVIAHNVIGPSINYEGYGHYIQVGGINGLVVNNNAFEGPQYWGVDQDLTSHLNVLHVDGGQTNVTFDNNIMWHTDTRAQSVLMQNAPMNNITMENNLDIEDPQCETDSNCNSSPADIEAAHGLSYEHNTTVNAAWSILLGEVASGDDTYTDPQDMIAEDNIAVGNSVQGNSNYGLWQCTSSCTIQDNTSEDSSANSTLGGTGNVVNWTPSWITTSWTPVDGPGYVPPPAGYYQPTDLSSIAGAGYQGQIGP